MAQIIPAAPNALDIVSRDIGSGLQKMLEHKLGQLNEQQQSEKNLKDLLSSGISQQDAQLLNMFHKQPEIQAKLLGELFQRGPSDQGNMQQSLGQQAQQMQPQQQFGLNELAQILTQQPGAQQALQGLMGQGQAQQPQIGQQSPQRPPIAEAQPSGSSFYREPLKQKQAREQKEAALQFKEKQLSSKEKSEAFKETKELRNEILHNAKAARQDLRDLDRMEELEKEGKLDTPGYTEGLKRAGFDIPNLLEEGSEEFEKIKQGFLKNAKTYFGSRISNYEVEQFLKTIPSLSQSPEGRKRVISNLKYMARAALEYNNAMKDIVAENKGVPPLDLAERIDDKIEKKLDGLAKQFKKDLSRPVPKGQNKLITALQAGAGSLVGGLGPILKTGGSAGAGAFIGSLLAPGVGTALGGLGGAALGSGALGKLFGQ